MGVQRKREGPCRPGRTKAIYRSPCFGHTEDAVTYSTSRLTRFLARPNVHYVNLWTYHRRLRRATETVATVIEAQRMLADHTWPQDVMVKARLGLHTG